jgi:hypothetical protein
LAAPVALGIPSEDLGRDEADVVTEAVMRDGAAPGLREQPTRRKVEDLAGLVGGEKRLAVASLGERLRDEGG